jgi:hypothetical protein
MASTLHRLSRSNGPVTADARDRSDRLVAFVASVAAASPDSQLPLSSADQLPARSRALTAVV